MTAVYKVSFTLAYHPNGYGTKAMIHARCPADESDELSGSQIASLAQESRIRRPSARDGSTKTLE
jgi:hypothetical protein